MTKAKKRKKGRPYILIVLKLSGEVLCDKGRGGFSIRAAHFIARQLVQMLGRSKKYRLVIILGGGNLLRGGEVRKHLKLFDGTACDHAGMLATVANAVIFQSFLEENYGLDTRVATAIHCDEVAEPYIRRRVIRHLEKGRVVILAGGMGQPGFSTDTAMVKRAVELRADIILKGTKVNGVYDRDPVKYPKEARHLKSITATEFLNHNLKIVDSTAVTIARDAGVSIGVFDIFKAKNFRKILAGRSVGSVIVP